MCSLRTHLPQSMKIALCCCILHNVSVKWGIEEPPDDDQRDEDDDIIIVDDDVGRAAVRARGEVIRDRMRVNMPPPTRSESAKMGIPIQRN